MWHVTGTLINFRHHVVIQEVYVFKKFKVCVKHRHI